MELEDAVQGIREIQDVRRRLFYIDPRNDLSPLGNLMSDESIQRTVYIANHVADGRYFLERPSQERARASRAFHPNVIAKGKYENGDLYAEFEAASDSKNSYDEPSFLEVVRKKVAYEEKSLQEELLLADDGKLRNEISSYRAFFMQKLEKSNDK